ncbi:hypothetical protein [Saccharicrinis sp. FJH54]|uniref:hypothetical protein n=1 Tax=Saccharicrinis sp. FJH54 TaxID=3344665 RepID=UPI0035D4B4B5
MKDLAKHVEDILDDTKKQAVKNNADFEQIRKLDEALTILNKLEDREKPSYCLPPVDTLGKQTYTNLNRK